jgi:hypothetical protein
MNFYFLKMCHKCTKPNSTYQRRRRQTSPQGEKEKARNELQFSCTRRLLPLIIHKKSDTPSKLSSLAPTNTPHPCPRPPRTCILLWLYACLCVGVCDCGMIIEAWEKGAGPRQVSSLARSYFKHIYAAIALTPSSKW